LLGLTLRTRGQLISRGQFTMSHTVPRGSAHLHYTHYSHYTPRLKAAQCPDTAYGAVPIHYPPCTYAQC